MSGISFVLLTAAAAWSSQAWATQAQPVPIPEEPSIAPQIQIDGVGIGTLAIGRTGEQTGVEGGLNLSDSAVILGAAQRLYTGEGIGSFALGAVTTDETNHGVESALFIHQAFVGYQSERMEILLGRADNPTAHLVDFPTLRGDDLLTLTNPLDPFSNGKNIEEHRYANVASVRFNQGLRFYETFHVQHLINSAGIGTENGINSFGVSFEYLAAPGLEIFETFSSWGASFEHITLNASSPGGIHQISAGGVLNLNDSVTHHWDLRLQDIVSLGSDLTAFQSITDSFQADSHTIAAALRFLHSPFGRPGYQLSLTAGHKNYFKVNGAHSVGGALTAVKRLGQGFDLIAQYQGQWRSSSLAQVQSPGISFEQVGEVGFVFNFSATFNQHISPRRTLLNQQHQYVPN